MPYFEMSLENDREYVYQNDFSVVESDLGMWLIVFLDVDVASKKETYFGFKFHALTTVDGFLTDYVITPANIDDRNAVWDLCDKYRSISIIGDKGYINKRLTPELKGERDINLLFKVRRRIETSFSQLTEQLNLNKVKSKSMLGFITRTSIKVLAHNISFLINKLMRNDDSMAKIKRLVFG